MTLVEQHADDVVARRAKGESVRSIAKALDISRATIDRCLRAKGVLGSPEPETPDPVPAGGRTPGAAVSPHPPADTSRAGRDPSSPTAKYRGLFEGLITETREALQDEPHKRTRQTIEVLVSDLEARSAQNLRALDRDLARQAQARAARPRQIRQSLEALGSRKIKAEARVADAEAAVDTATTDRGKRAAERQLDFDRKKLADVERVIGWRERELESAIADAEAA